MKALFTLWDDWKESDYAEQSADRWLQLKAAGIQALRIIPAYSSSSHHATILDRNAEEGLVHQWMNYDKIKAASPYALCCCCKCCCIIWHAADIRSVSNDALFAKSRYEARVDAELCVGRRKCVDRCQFDAIDIQPADVSGEVIARVDPEKCWGCGVCTLTCKAEALGMHPVRPPIISLMPSRGTSPWAPFAQKLDAAQKNNKIGKVPPHG